MTGFYIVSHASHENAPLVWIQAITEGLNCHVCKTCGANICYPGGCIIANLAPHRISRWPDVIGSGAYPLLIVSNRAKQLVTIKGLAPESVFGSVKFSSIPDGSTPPPIYFWVDGRELIGAAVDFEKSGFVDVRFCTECGNRTDNVSATYQKRRELGSPYIFKSGSWMGHNLFTTDVSPTLFFASEELVHLFKVNNLKNFEFDKIAG